MATPAKDGDAGSQPAAASSDIEEKFKLIAPSLGLPASELEKMTSAQKEVLVKQHTTKAAVNSDSITPEMIIKRLESGKHKEATVEKLRTCIRSELLPWTDHFLALNGHLHLFEILSNAFEKDKKTEKNILLVAECCRCMKALMNTPEGLTKVLEWNQSIEILLDSIESVNILSQAEILMVMAGLCFLSSDAHVRILTEMRKSNRFPSLMEYVSSKNEGLMTAALTFVNALIGATSDTQSRVEIRNEFLKMNIRDVVNKERLDPAQSLTVQIRAFNNSTDEDLDTLIKAGAITAPSAAPPTTEAMQSKVAKLETQIKSLEFEIVGLKEENAALKKSAASRPSVSASDASAAATATPTPATTETPADGSIPAVPAAEGSAEGGPPPPPVPGGDGAPPPPPPPGGGPPPPPPPPGGGPPPPPPPPGGGPPGPPPPPGAPAAPAAPKRPAKAKCKPNRKMKAFQWTKIADAKIDNTIWEKTNDNSVKLDTLELESIFGVVESGQGGAAGAKTPRESLGAASPGAIQAKKQTVQLLDPKRANNCEIMLRGLKMEPSAIRAAILSMDEKVLTEDTLRSMKEYVPLPEEIQILKDYPGDKKQLGRAEQYFLAVMDLPKLTARLTAMAYKAGFAEKSENAKSDIHTLSSAITAVKSSQNLFKMLEVVLAIGNYMNGAGNAGGCYGFRINSLNKMLDVKSSDGKMSLMHYLYELVAKKYKELLSLNTELSACAEASRLNIRETMAHVAELKTGFATVETLLADTAVDAAFSKAMGAFASSAKTTIEQLDNRVSTLEPKFKECVTYYGEPSSTEPEDFFGAINNFLESFARAKSENEKRAAAAAKEAQSKALLAAVQAKQVAKKKGQLDDTIEGMKNGTMFARVSVSSPPDQRPQK